jgi:hypothetical protein
LNKAVGRWVEISQVPKSFTKKDGEVVNYVEKRAKKSNRQIIETYPEVNLPEPLTPLNHSQNYSAAQKLATPLRSNFVPGTDIEFPF